MADCGDEVKKTWTKDSGLTQSEFADLVDTILEQAQAEKIKLQVQGQGAQNGMKNWPRRSREEIQDRKEISVRNAAFDSLARAEMLRTVMDQ